jgi:hypothetical protein
VNAVDYASVKKTVCGKNATVRGAVARLTERLEARRSESHNCIHYNRLREIEPGAGAGVRESRRVIGFHRSINSP